MKTGFPICGLLLVAMLAAPLPGHAQEVAGRVLVSVGEVSILRAGQATPAPRGAEVRAGDTLQLGTQSNAQVRFTDESVVALRPETSFQVSEYAFQGREPTARSAVFNLLKGGMRTITGLIGRAQRTNYKVLTPNASLGIRGTNYSLVLCDSGCRNPNGSAAPSGTYGAVSDGRISMSNQSGEREFGINQFFYVASQTSPPQQLIAPPSFLRDTLEGRARRSGGSQQTAVQETAGTGSGSSSAGSQTVTTTAQTGANAGSGDTQVSATVTNAVIPVVAPVTIVPVSTQTSVSGPSTIVLPSDTATVFYRVAGSFNIPVTSCNSPPCGSITAGDITLAVNLTTQRAGITANFISTNGSGGSTNTFNVGTPFTSGGIPITINGGQISFNTTFNRADYPTQQGAFRCFNCGTGNTGSTFLDTLIDTLTISGTVSGSTANVTLSGTKFGTNGAANSSGQFSLSLDQTAVPNSFGGAVVVPVSAGGSSTASSSFWGVSADTSGRLLSLGPTVGADRVSVGSASNTIVGSAPTAGNLVWGTWGSGASVTDVNYSTFTSSSVIPWITTSNITTTLPTSLGTAVTYSPVGFIVNGSSTTGLNSALLTADFVNRSVALSINATNLTNSNRFQMNGTSGIAQSSGRFSAGWTSITCSGGPCTGISSISGSFAGFFAGTNAEGAGVAFSGGFSGNGVTGVIGLKR